MQCAHSKHIKHSHMTRLRKFQRREQNQTAVLLLWMPLQYFLAKAGSWCLASMFKDKWVFPKIGGYPPKSSILIGFSIINHPFWGTPIFGNTQIKNCMQLFFFKTWLSKPYGFFHTENSSNPNLRWRWKATGNVNCCGEVMGSMTNILCGNYMIIDS